MQVLSETITLASGTFKLIHNTNSEESYNHFKLASIDLQCTHRHQLSWSITCKGYDILHPYNNNNLNSNQE